MITIRHILLFRAFRIRRGSAAFASRPAVRSSAILAALGGAALGWPLDDFGSL